MKMTITALTATILIAAAWCHGANALPIGPYSGISETDHPIDPAIHWTDSRIAGWATGYDEYYRSDGQTGWSDPSSAFGAPGGSGDIVSLGDLSEGDITAGMSPGYITMTFDTPITNRLGHDFAVFENGFPFGPGLFAELAYVEVSTDGEHFARFPSFFDAADEPIGAFAGLDVTEIYNLAGKHQNGYGTPFDLAQLTSSELVQRGRVSLDEINYVRIVDIPGSGDWADSDGNSIFDNWPTTGSGGLDLNAVGAMNVVPEPGTIILLGAGLGGLFVRRLRNRHSA
ncbi:MAG: PEP-CTERM sorting domain-containing protein [Candidatus Hydrogenedentota bacterium]